MLHTKYQSSRTSSFRVEELWNFRSLFPCSTYHPQGGASFDPRDILWTNLLGPQGDAIYQISNLYANQFQRRKILRMGFFVPTCDPCDRASFDPWDIIWTNLIEVLKEMLYTKYQSSRPSSFREEEFWNFLSLFLCSDLWPMGQARFWPQGHHMNKLGRGPLEDAIYQISKH